MRVWGPSDGTFVLVGNVLEGDSKTLQLLYLYRYAC